MPTWNRKVPDALGHWLRLNAGNRISRHFVVELDGELSIDWGWGDQIGMVPLTNPKLKGWLWYGPIPSPPNVEPYEPGEPE